MISDSGLRERGCALKVYAAGDSVGCVFFTCFVCVTYSDRALSDDLVNYEGDFVVSIGCCVTNRCFAYDYFDDGYIDLEDNFSDGFFAIGGQVTVFDVQYDYA